MTHERKADPWTCLACGERRVRERTGPHTTRLKHDGAWYDLEIPDLRAPRCGACGEVQITAEVDERLLGALRARLDLLAPGEIREKRRALHLTQKRLAAELGAAEETISRWETGTYVQSRAMDNLLRVYFEIPQVRAALRGRSVAGGRAPASVSGSRGGRRRGRRGP